MLFTSLNNRSNYSCIKQCEESMNLGRKSVLLLGKSMCSSPEHYCLESRTTDEYKVRKLRFTEVSEYFWIGRCLNIGISFLAKKYPRFSSARSSTVYHLVFKFKADTFTCIQDFYFVKILV